MNQRGQFTLPLMGYVAIGVGVVILGMGIALKVQSSRLESCKAEGAAFVAQVKANGEIAAKQAKAKEAQDAKQIQDAVTTRDAALKRLHDANSTIRKLSDNSAPASADSSVCFPTAVYNAAMGRFRKSLERSMADARRNAEQGDAAQIDAQALVRAWPLKMATDLSH